MIALAVSEVLPIDPYIRQNDFEWYVPQSTVTLTNIWPPGTGANLAENEVFTQLPGSNEALSKGDQIRDFMSIKSVVSNIIQISKQNNVLGAINCCSNEPISVRKFVESYLKKHDYNLKLNLGYYPYPTYESMAFWGDDSRLKKIKDEI